ncbi:hypothetical protein ACFQI7_27985 [Paenibacillus allorhizosphaerae]|uniref:Uncharacterized protein n=1 Tax=Paenibacillus allorhizosphaerae TaxID=2849866 RepID=A0ABM8VNP2_9BACL|nr:hypothetical protein [Paenibacillus allorhizosphaerae]CAG7651637.1 hypothetical protein PAECIP111802_05014 [Paenibacillus allorhizosphaerae]
MHVLIFEGDRKLGEVLNGMISKWRFKSKYRHYNRVYLWDKYGTGHSDREILYALVGPGESLTKQSGSILFIKEDGKGKFLPLSEEDVDALTLYMEIHKTVEKLEQHLRYSQINYEEGLKELKSIHEKIYKVDSSMEGWISPVAVLSHLSSIIAKHFHANNVARGFQIIYSFLCETKNIKEATSELHQLANSDRYNEVMDPSDKEFVYHLSKYDCFMRRTGKCSLDLSPSEFQEYQIQDENNRSEASVHYCRNLLQSFQTIGIQNSVEIQHNTACDHYSFTDGQHRSCIAKKVQMNLPAKIAIQQSYCRICSSRRSGDTRIIDADDYIA